MTADADYQHQSACFVISSDGHLSSSLVHVAEMLVAVAQNPTISIDVHTRDPYQSDCVCVTPTWQGRDAVWGNQDVPHDFTAENFPPGTLVRGEVDIANASGECMATSGCNVILGTATHTQDGEVLIAFTPAIRYFLIRQFLKHLMRPEFTGLSFVDDTFHKALPDVPRFRVFAQ